MKTPATDDQTCFSWFIFIMIGPWVVWSEVKWSEVAERFKDSLRQKCMLKPNLKMQKLKYVSAIVFL